VELHSKHGSTAYTLAGTLVLESTKFYRVTVSFDDVADETRLYIDEVCVCVCMYVACVILYMELCYFLTYTCVHTGLASDSQLDGACPSVD
jgi:hypothetical protein